MINKRLFHGQTLYCKNGDRVTVHTVNYSTSTMVVLFNGRYYERSIPKSLNVTLFEQPYKEIKISSNEREFVTSTAEALYFEKNGMALPVMIESYAEGARKVKVLYAKTPRELDKSFFGNAIVRFEDLSAEAKKYLNLIEIYYDIANKIDGNIPDDIGRLSELVTATHNYLCNELYLCTQGHTYVKDDRKDYYEDDDYLSTGNSPGYYCDHIDIDAAEKILYNYAAY